MKTTKKLGIWMDHSIAYLMEFTSNPFEIKTIESTFTHQKKRSVFAKSESAMHDKERQQIASYHRKLSEVIKDYKRVLLFGPTNAKTDLFDYLSEDDQFVNIKIEIKETDKMTASQKDVFVRTYFSKA